MKNEETNLDNLKDRIVKLYFKNLKKLISLPSKEPLNQFYENRDEFCSHIEYSADDYEIVKNMSGRLVGHRELATLFVLASLIVSEGIISNTFDFLCYLLVVDEHDLFDNIRNKYVTSFNEIRKVGMYYKIKFLNHHGFKELTAKCDTTFRNDIAHHNYTIDDDGNLWIRRKKINVKSKVADNIELMGFFINFIHEIGTKQIK